MSEELENIDTELEENNIIPEEVAQELESTENIEEQEVKEPEVERPWKKEKTIPDTIPYSRFSEVNREKRDLELRLVEYESKLNQYNQLEQKTKEITSVEELASKVGEMDINEYTQTLIKLVEKQTDEKRQRQEDQARIQKIEQDISSAYISKIEEAAKKNPEIKDAAQYLTENYAQYLSKETRYALVTDDHAAEVIFEIATNKDLINFICTANPIDVTRKIARISAKYDSDNSKPVSKPQAEAFVPKSTPTGSPKTTNSVPPTSRKYSDAEIAKMSLAQYKQAKSDGRI
jgi:hypothetical protein